MSVTIELNCFSKTEIHHGQDTIQWTIKLGGVDDPNPFIIDTYDPVVANEFIAARKYKGKFTLFNEDDLSMGYLMDTHKGLTEYEAYDLLKYCKKNTITRKTCYGDGSIMFPKWKESKCHGTLIEQTKS